MNEMMRDPYVTAPDMDSEREALVKLAAKLHQSRPQAAAVRELALRTAAWMDRAALAAPGAARAAQEAELCARTLLTHDGARGTGLGPIPARWSGWQPDPRAYVRQEYAAAFPR